MVKNHKEKIIASVYNDWMKRERKLKSRHEFAVILLNNNKDEAIYRLYDNEINLLRDYECYTNKGKKEHVIIDHDKCEYDQIPYALLPKFY